MIKHTVLFGLEPTGFVRLTHLPRRRAYTRRRGYCEIVDVQKGGSGRTSGRGWRSGQV